MDTSQFKLFTSSVTVEHKKKLLKYAADKDQFAYEALHEVLAAGFKALTANGGKGNKKRIVIDNPLLVR